MPGMVCKASAITAASHRGLLTPFLFALAAHLHAQDDLEFFRKDGGKLS